MPRSIRIENFEISLNDGEPMLSFDLPDPLLMAFPLGLSGEPSCRLEEARAVLSYAEADLEFPGAPKDLLRGGAGLLCAQMGRGDVIAADYAKGRA